MFSGKSASSLMIFTFSPVSNPWLDAKLNCELKVMFTTSNDLTELVVPYTAPFAGSVSDINMSAE